MRRFCFFTLILITVLFVDCVSIVSAEKYNGEFIFAKTEPDPLISELFCTHVVTVKNTGTDYTPFELKIYRSSNRLEKEEFSLSAGDTITLLLGGVMGDPGPRTYTYKLYQDRTWPKQDILLDTFTEERYCFSLEEVSYIDNKMIEVYLYAAYAQDEIDFAKFFRADTTEAESILQQAMIALNEGKHGDAKDYASQSKNSAENAMNARLTLYAIVILIVMLNVIGLKNKKKYGKEEWNTATPGLLDRTQKIANEARSVIEKWQACPICGSEWGFEIWLNNIAKIACKSCYAEWTLHPKEIISLKLRKPGLHGKGIEIVGENHPPEWWIGETLSPMVSIRKSTSFEYIKLFANKYIEENKILFWDVSNHHLTFLLSYDYDGVSYKLLFKDKPYYSLPKKQRTKIDQDIVSLRNDIDRLKRLLAKNSFIFTENEIEALITQEIGIQTYKKFKAHVLSKEPKKVEEYITYFVEYLTFKYENPAFVAKSFIPYIERLLEDEKIEFGKDKLLHDIEQVISELELKQFERELLRSPKKVQQVTLDELDKMDGYEFERFLSVLYEKLGYKVLQTQLSRDQGADLVIVKNGERIVVQAKRYSNNVSNKAIPEIAAAIKHYGADRGIVVTTSGFTPSAIELAESNNIELVDRNKIEQLIGNVQESC